MNKNWKNFCLNGKCRLYIEENCKLDGTVYTTSSQLENTGFLNIEGSVPGNFELDMQKAGLLPDDMFYSDNALLLQKLENRHLWYVMKFDAKLSDNKQYLRFEGVDTFSQIYLNGELIGTTDNMLIPYEFEATSLKNGENELVIHIIPVFLKAREAENEAGVVIHQFYNAEAANIRKAQHMFGWDIMCRAMSGGLYRNVYLFEKPADCIEDAYIATAAANENNALLHFYFRTKISADFLEGYTINVKGKCGDSEFELGEKDLWHTESKHYIKVSEPKLWWPKGMGQANLYDVTVELKKDGKLIDEYKLRIGIRTFKLYLSDIIDDDGNGKFEFEVNGNKMFARGTNWVPLDPFHSRDLERMPMALKLLDESNCNMVRCWGGNVYEDDAFYNFCDEHGIAVWQDFGMACCMYPQGDEFASQIRNEAEKIIKRLRNHPSIAVWVGDNECDESRVLWHPAAKFNPNDNRLTREVLPREIQRFDPFRSYMPSSPYISKYAFESGQYAKTPEKHLWGPRGYFKADFYSNAICRFVSETGYHGCPGVESLKKFISPENLWPWQDNLEWIFHATNMEKSLNANYAYRIGVMDRQISCFFDFHPDNLDDFVIASQLTQAEADKYFVERYRLGKWKSTSGIIVWNLMDGWPQFSDSVVDYYGTPKIAYNVLKNCQEPVCVIFREPIDNKLTLACANDTLGQIKVKYTVTDMFKNEMVLEGTADVSANVTADIGEMICDTAVNTFYLIDYEINGKKYFNHYICGKAPIDFDACKKAYKQMGYIK
ncbi:MAG: glycoside hydrolase family 2 TIM barrel-domain containing protein [Acutalibacteraceae bacterium]|nr:glycoside hydrolase family 2 TIM barrel-domain containing protein [Acutalibacteraceae bacterium]